jgi:hypothetical protein
VNSAWLFSRGKVLGFAAETLRVLCLHVLMRISVHECDFEFCRACFVAASTRFSYAVAPASSEEFQVQVHAGFLA